MDLGLQTIRTRGRAKSRLAVEVAGELSGADVALLSEEKGIAAPATVRLRHRHHILALKIARGLPPSEAGIQCGISGNRVSILMRDKSFKELLDYYSSVSLEDNIELSTNLQAELLGVAHDSVRVLSERIEDDPDSIPNRELIKMAELGADRSGFGPQATQNVNVHVGLAERLKEARKRVEARMIDITPENSDVE